MAEIKLKIASVVIGSGEGGGSGVAPYYADLPDKPTINGETLSGAMTSEDLGLAPSSQSVPTGGTTGQVLAKKSNADNDVQWVNQQSGGQGTTDYADLENKPKINNVTLSGNKTATQLGLQAELVSGTNIKTINNQSIVGSGNITIEGGGTDDYSELSNKPQINSVALSGNKSASELGLATAAQGALAASAYQKPQTGIPSTDLASGVQTSLGKADTAVQQVTVDPDTVTGNAGTNASVTNTGTQTAPVLKFTIPRGADGQNGADAVNPFKGWLNSLAELKAAHTAIEGDSAYVKDASPATTWSIYVYDSTASSDEYWADSGLDADTSNVQTFASGEEVNLTPIDNTHLSNPVQGSIPLALDVISKINSFGLTVSAKDLIISIFKKCAFVSADAEEYIDALEEEFAGTKILIGITATMPQSYSVHEGQSVDVLRNYLTVTADYDDGSHLPITTYQLNGSLTYGTSSVIVSYQFFTDTVQVNVGPFELDFSNDEILKKVSISAQYQNTNSTIPYASNDQEVTSVKKRCCYPYFDKLIKGGTYQVQITTNDARTKVGFQCFTKSALSKVANNQDLVAAGASSPTIDGYDSGWVSFTDELATITLPDLSTSDPLSELVGMRLSLKIDDGSSMGALIPTTYSVALHITEVVNNS